jgi:hypothetical protein
MSASESHRKTDVMAHAITDRVSETCRATSGEEIVDTSGQYAGRGELEKPFDELKTSEDNSESWSTRSRHCCGGIRQMAPTNS